MKYYVSMFLAFAGEGTLDQNLLKFHGNLMFDKRQLKEAYKIRLVNRATLGLFANSLFSIVEL